MMDIAIVGNGPTAAMHGAEIDAAGFVVRCNDCRYMGQGSGTKLNALAWFGSRGAGVYVPQGYYEHWITLPPSRCWPPNWEHIGGWQRIVDQAEARVSIRWITDYQWQKEEVFVRKPPTTGFTAVHLALLQFAPCRIVLYGFDATLPNCPNYEHRMNADHHDFFAEKRLLVDLCDADNFLGSKWGCEMVWVDRPEIPTVAAVGSA